MKEEIQEIIDLVDRMGDAPDALDLGIQGKKIYAKTSELGQIEGTLTRLLSQGGSVESVMEKIKTEATKMLAGKKFIQLHDLLKRISPPVQVTEEHEAGVKVSVNVTVAPYVPPPSKPPCVWSDDGFEEVNSYWPSNQRFENRDARRSAWERAAALWPDAEDDALKACRHYANEFDAGKMAYAYHLGTFLNGDDGALWHQWFEWASSAPTEQDKADFDLMRTWYPKTGHGEVETAEQTKSLVALYAKLVPPQDRMDFLFSVKQYRVDAHPTEPQFRHGLRWWIQNWRSRPRGRELGHAIFHYLHRWLYDVGQVANPRGYSIPGDSEWLTNRIKYELSKVPEKNAVDVVPLALAFVTEKHGDKYDLSGWREGFFDKAMAAARRPQGVLAPIPPQRPPAPVRTDPAPPEKPVGWVGPLTKARREYASMVESWSRPLPPGSWMPGDPIPEGGIDAGNLFDE